MLSEQGVQVHFSKLTSDRIGAVQQFCFVFFTTKETKGDLDKMLVQEHVALFTTAPIINLHLRLKQRINWKQKDFSR